MRLQRRPHKACALYFVEAWLQPAIGIAKYKLCLFTNRQDPIHCLVPCVLAYMSYKASLLVHRGDNFVCANLASSTDMHNRRTTQQWTHILLLSVQEAPLLATSLHMCPAAHHRQLFCMTCSVTCTNPHATMQSTAMYLVE